MNFNFLVQPCVILNGRYFIRKCLVTRIFIIMDLISVDVSKGEIQSIDCECVYVLWTSISTNNVLDLQLTKYFTDLVESWSEICFDCDSGNVYQTDSVSAKNNIDISRKSLSRSQAGNVLHFCYEWWVKQL